LEELENAKHELFLLLKKSLRDDEVRKSSGDVHNGQQIPGTPAHGAHPPSSASTPAQSYSSVHQSSSSTSLFDLNRYEDRAVVEVSSRVRTLFHFA
jgi:hypothetical protein